MPSWPCSVTGSIATSPTKAEACDSQARSARRWARAQSCRRRWTTARTPCLELVSLVFAHSLVPSRGVMFTAGSVTSSRPSSSVGQHLGTPKMMLGLRANWHKALALSLPAILPCARGKRPTTNTPRGIGRLREAWLRGNNETIGGTDDDWPWSQRDRHHTIASEQKQTKIRVAPVLVGGVCSRPSRYPET